MKILVCIDHMESGGAARVTSIMCQGLAQRGYEVMLAYNRQRNTLYDCGTDVQFIDNYVARHGKSHLAGVMLLIRRVKRYRSIIREVQPDIVIGVEPEPYLYAYLACIGKKLPVVAVDHITFNYKGQHWFTHWIRWHAYRWANKVSILSYVDEAILGKRLPNKIVVHNPISFDIFNNPIRRENIVLCVGRIDGWKQKGFDKMINIWKEVQQSHPDWKLIIAGDGNPESFHFLKQLALNQQIDGSIHFVGAVTDMQSLYQRASIFALPSRFEGFPMCLLEAASQGCACVAFDLHGITSEIFTDNVEGIIIPDNDDHLFATKINYLIENPKVMTSFSLAISKRMENFSKENFINKWEQICDSFNK